MFVLPLTDPGLSEVYDAVSECKRLAEEELPEIGNSYWSTVLEPLFYRENAGSDATIEKAEFSFRTIDDYRTSDFRLYEDRWQQMSRLSGSAGQTWEEQPVTCQGDDTYPYPGKENFQGPKLYQQPLELFDVANGRAKARGEQPELAEEYKNPQFGTPTPVELSEYTVIN